MSKYDNPSTAFAPVLASRHQCRWCPRKRGLFHRRALRVAQITYSNKWRVRFASWRIDVAVTRRWKQSVFNYNALPIDKSHLRWRSSAQYYFDHVRVYLAPLFAQSKNEIYTTCRASAHFRQPIRFEILTLPSASHCTLPVINRAMTMFNTCMFSCMFKHTNDKHGLLSDHIIYPFIYLFIYLCICRHISVYIEVL
jgi:hypothetical protein